MKRRKRHKRLFNQKSEIMIEIQNLKVKEICESPMNPRKRFEKADIEELAKNIAEQGLLQPITVRPPRDGMETFEKIDKDGKAHGFKYEVVCGARRFRAINHLGWKEVPAIVREMTDAEAFDAMITENLQRKDVDPIDEAVAFSELMRKGQSVKELAARFGKSERYIQDRTKLCGLIKELQKELTKGHIPLVGAIYLAKCDEDTQRSFYDDEIDGCFDDDDTDCYPYSDIKEFVTRSFHLLANTEWMKEGEEESWNDEKDVPKCKGCEFNTASHGCLFYEMKGDAECTKESCFEKKELVFRKWKLMQMYDKMLKNGEEYTPDKIIVIESEYPSCKRDDEKEKFDEAVEFLKQSLPDVQIMSYRDFNGQCYYKEDDERLQKMLAEGKVFKTVRLYEDWHRFTIEYLYKGGVNRDTEEKTDEELLKIDLDKATSKNTEKLDGEFMKICNELTNDDFDGHPELLNQIIKLMVFDYCPYIFKNKAGISDEEKMDAFLNDPKRLSEVMREAARSFLTKYSFYASMGVALRKKVVRELMPETYEELVKKYEEKLGNAVEKIRAKYGEK